MTSSIQVYYSTFIELNLVAEDTKVLVYLQYFSYKLNIVSMISIIQL